MKYVFDQYMTQGMHERAAWKDPLSLKNVPD